MNPAVARSQAVAEESKIRVSQRSRVLCGVTVPDTPLVNRAIDMARDNLDPYLFNHSMRSWLFAMVLAGGEGEPIDVEVLSVSAILHDIGLSAALAGSLRFEVEGANLARDLAAGFEVEPRRLQLIWDSIALNSTPSICLHKEAEASMCVKGVGLDWGGWGYDLVPQWQVRRILSAFPRLGMKRRFTRAICRICERQPELTYDNFARDFGERFVPGYQGQSSVDAFLESPFGE